MTYTLSYIIILFFHYFIGIAAGSAGMAPREFGRILGCMDKIKFLTLNGVLQEIPVDSTGRQTFSPYGKDELNTLDWDSQSLYTAAILENGGPNRALSRGPCEHSEDCYGISLLTLKHVAIGFAMQRVICFYRILTFSKAISGITEPIRGMFVLIREHFSWRF